MICSMQELTQHRYMDVAISTKFVFAQVCMKHLCLTENYYQLEHHLVNTSGKACLYKSLYSFCTLQMKIRRLNPSRNYFLHNKVKAATKTQA